MTLMFPLAAAGAHAAAAAAAILRPREWSPEQASSPPN